MARSPDDALKGADLQPSLNEPDDTVSALSQGSARPLDGIRILSFTQFLMGPAGVQYLGDLGADVIKVENPKLGAWERSWAGADALIGGASIFHLLANRNQRGLTLNLKHARAREVVWDLLAETDVLVENFRPGVMERLGFGYEHLRGSFPRLVYISASGYGDSGPYRDQPGQDLLVQALSGLASVTGRASEGPVPTGAAVVDQHGAALIALAALAALRLRDSTGVGSKVEVSLLLAALDLQQEPLGYHLNGFPFTRSEAGLGSGFHPAPYGIYRTSDGYLALSLTPRERLEQVEEFAGVKDCPAESLYALRDRIKRVLEPIIAQRPTGYWLDHLSRMGIWCGPVLDYDGVLRDPQVEYLDPIVTFDYPGVGAVRALGLPFRIGGYSPVMSRPPRLGEHTDEILSSVGIDDDRIAELRREGVV